MNEAYTKEQYTVETIQRLCVCVIGDQSEEERLETKCLQR